MNYKFRELLEFRISIKSYENTNKVGPTHLFQIASCFLAFPTFRNVASVRELDFTAQITWWYCALAHLRGNIGLVLGRTVARKFSIGGLGLCGGGLTPKKLTKTQLIYSVSCFNLGGLEASFGGLSPQKTPVATGLVLGLLVV